MGDRIWTVRGYVSRNQIGLADAHGHLWVEKVAGRSDPAAPILDDPESIEKELAGFHSAGGQTVVDCQPGDCGRNANRLLQLSIRTGVKVIACTGFHLERYYAGGHWLWSATEQAAHVFFHGELIGGVRESVPGEPPIRAGVIKVAITQTPDAQTIRLMHAAASASCVTGAAILVHTEQGAGAEHLPTFFADVGVSPAKLMLCHMDKRPDFELHSELARSGVLLVYDTFLRDKYLPETNVWPLIERMAAANLEEHVALALDAADRRLWRFGGGGGIAYLPERLVPRLFEMGLIRRQVRRLTGENLSRVLSV